MLSRYKARSSSAHCDITIPLQVRLDAVQAVMKTPEKFYEYKRKALAAAKLRKDSDTARDIAVRQLPCKDKTFESLQCLQT